MTNGVEGWGVPIFGMRSSFRLNNYFQDFIYRPKVRTTLQKGHKEYYWKVLLGSFIAYE